MATVTFSAKPNQQLSTKLYPWPEATGTPAENGYAASEPSPGAYAIAIAENLLGQFKVVASDLQGNAAFVGMVQIDGVGTYAAVAADQPAEQTTEDALSAAIADPKMATVDGVTFQNHSPKDLIEADRYQKANKAAKKPHKGLRLTKIVSGGPS